MLRKRFAIVAVCSVVLLVAASCSDSRSPGITEGRNRVKNMKPRVFIATMAMNALLDANPSADVKALTERSFEIADAMIDEAEKANEDAP